MPGRRRAPGLPGGRVGPVAVVGLERRLGPGRAVQDAAHGDGLGHCGRQAGEGDEIGPPGPDRDAEHHGQDRRQVVLGAHDDLADGRMLEHGAPFGGRGPGGRGRVGDKRG